MLQLMITIIMKHHNLSVRVIKHQVVSNCKVNSTRLKERLLKNCSTLTAVSHGRYVFITFTEDMGSTLQQMHEHSDAQAVYLMHTTKVIRKEIFSHSSKFNGSLSVENASLPSTLMTLVHMLLEGPGTSQALDNQAAMSIAQLIIFNAIKHPPRNKLSSVSEVHETRSAGILYHSTTREMHLPIYIGLKLHSATRSRKLVESISKLGICISYARVMQIENKCANSVCNIYRSENLVCPPIHELGFFTVAAADNIDHNSSSTKAQSALHGTAISLMQFAYRPFQNASPFLMS
jgi:hypothetical protein